MLIGDAAHAVSPNVAAGATNAMHDAALLAPCALDLVMLPSPLRPLQSFRSSKSFKDIVLGSPKRSSAETNAWGFDRFESLAEEWTLSRLEDAHAISEISRKLNDGILYSVHKDLGLFLRAMPVYIPWGLGSSAVPGRGAVLASVACCCTYAPL